MGNFGLHHVTAVTADISSNHRFYTDVLGLRLVKKSVNQDDVSAYHLFYADSVGTPGTDMTFFDWPTIGANFPGMATIALTSFRVPEGSLSAWESRLGDAGAAPIRGGDGDAIEFADPEGQRLELVADHGSALTSKPWTKVVPETMAIQGLYGVDLESARPESTARVLEHVLGYRQIGEDLTYTNGVDARLRIVSSEPRRMGRVGAGGVHHVAFRVDNDEALHAAEATIRELGIATSGFVDRFYFHSLYFREPGGILFELATDGPGFTTDESMDSLGQNLALPPFLENRRSEIEAGLKPL